MVLLSTKIQFKMPMLRPLGWVMCLAGCFFFPTGLMAQIDDETETDTEEVPVEEAVVQEQPAADATSEIATTYYFQKYEPSSETSTSAKDVKFTFDVSIENCASKTQYALVYVYPIGSKVPTSKYSMKIKRSSSTTSKKHPRPFNGCKNSVYFKAKKLKLESGDDLLKSETTLFNGMRKKTGYMTMSFGMENDLYGHKYVFHSLTFFDAKGEEISIYSYTP